MRVVHVWAVALAAVGAARGQGFCDKLKALAVEPAVAAAHWGVSVTALDGTVLCSLNEAQLFRPASNNKLFTMAAALSLLGPDRRFTTTVVAEGDLTDGVLKGNLRLVGGGDANFGSTDVPYVEPAQRPKGSVQEPATIKDIEDLADQVYAKGVRTITGDVVGDDSYFAWEPYPVGWGIEDLAPGYGAPVSALTIHDSEVEIDVAPDAVKAGQDPLVSSFPDVAYYTIWNSAVTTALMDHPKAHIDVERAVGARLVTIAGQIPLNAAVVKETMAIQDPAEYAALALKEALERRGVKVTGTATPKHDKYSYAALTTHDYSDATLDVVLGSVANVPGSVLIETKCNAKVSGAPEPKGIVIASHESPSLGDDVLFTLKESQNLHAEVVLRNLGAALSCEHTVAASVGGLRAFLRAAGVAKSDLVLYDGSGLSGHGLVAPRAFTQLLVYAAKQKWFKTFKGALPVGGVDGTLASRFTAPGSKLTGKVFAKTGTLGESRALSGYVTAASGKTIVFSVMADNHPPGTTADRVAMDRMVDAIAAGN